MAVVYLLHFSKPIPQPRKGTLARHYLGIASDLDTRLEEHRRGQGAKIVAELIRRGGTFECVRTWSDAARSNELELKRQRNNPRLCPYCTKRKSAKTVLHGNNKGFKGWTHRDVYAKAHPKIAPVVVPDPDELPF